MRRFGTYDENGNYVGFYSDELHGDNIPEPNIELTEEQWKQAVGGDRCKVVNGVHIYTPITEDEELNKKYSQLRSVRDRLLSECDWTQIPDSPLTDAQKQAWATYRQALRDLPSTVDINNIVYPEKP